MSEPGTTRGERLLLTDGLYDSARILEKKAQALRAQANDLEAEAHRIRARACEIIKAELEDAGH